METLSGCTPLYRASTAARTGRSKGVLAALSVVCIFVAFAPVARELQDGLTTLQQVYVRTALATVFSAILWQKSILQDLRRHASSQQLSKETSLIVIRSCLLTVIAASTFSYSVQSIPLGTAAFLGTLPLSGLWGALLYKERLHQSHGVALSVGIVGMLLILTPSFTMNNTTSVLGQLAALACAASYSLAQSMRRLHSLPWKDTTVGFALLLAGTFLSVTLSLLLGEGLPAFPTPRSVVIAIIAGILVAAAAPLAGFTFLRLSNTEAGILLMLELPLTALVGSLVYGEVLTQRELAGGGLIAASAFVTIYFHKVGRRIYE